MVARATYEKGRETRARELAALEARSRAIGTGRLLVAVGILAFVGAIAWGRLGLWSWAGLGFGVASFVGLVLVHARIYASLERTAAGLRFHERGLARLDRAWERLPVTSERFRTPGHPFAADLDIFGCASVMQLLDATETRLGEEKLARWLGMTSVVAWPDEVLARQQAARDLAARTSFREALAMAGGAVSDDKRDLSPLLAWAEAKVGLQPWWSWLAWLVPASVAVGVASMVAMHAKTGLIMAVILTGLVVGMALGIRVTAMLEGVSARQSAATRWRGMLALIEGEPFESALLVELQQRLIRDGRRASKEMAALERIVGFADARHNEVFRFVIGPLLFWDVHCSFALLRWRARSGTQVSVGGSRRWARSRRWRAWRAFAFEHPDFAWPELSPTPLLEATLLTHPLLAQDHRVGNDVRLSGAGHALVVTGSNMSGKSTLLRAIGTNAVLAFAGAPVCASAMRIGRARVATSMRIEDSLEQGVSHFYAELRRLKCVLDLAAPSERGPVLFLLDEILHGTNSRERVLGACAVVRELLARGALGAVSTHDLGITALERELGGCVENVHFEEQVAGDTMTFDYILRHGIVQSSNALRLICALVGIAVSDIA